MSKPKPKPTEELSPTQSESPPEREYQSLRVKSPTHKLRFSNLPSKIEADGDQKITFRPAPYPHFCVSPSGVEIPLENVASAIPMAASIAGRLRKTGPMGARREAARAAKATRLAAAAEPEPVETEGD